MALEGKPLEEIREADLTDLIGITAEGTKIEYKERLALATDAERKEFLADVSAFANSSGGHLIFGVKEDSGLAAALAPMVGLDIDAEIRRLDNLIRDGIAPRVLVPITAVTIASGGVIIVMRIPRSWASPHMVTFKNHGKFYARNSAGKYQLDVGELRSAFLSTSGIADQISSFRDDRISAILRGETVIPTEPGPFVVMHVCPFDRGALHDLNQIYEDTRNLQPMCGTAWDRRFNLDGVLSFTVSGLGEDGLAYTQMFRDGTAEHFNASLLRPQVAGTGKVIPRLAVAAALIKALTRTISVYRTLGVTPPAAVLVTLAGVRGYEIAMHALELLEYTPRPIDRDLLKLPSALIEVLDADPAATLKPVLDALWNAGGLARCYDFDAAGQPVASLTQVINSGRF